MDKSLRIQVLLAGGDRLSGPLRTIAGGSKAAGAGIKAARDRLKELEKAQADLHEFKSLRAGLQATGEDLEMAKAKAQSLAWELNATEKPTLKMTRAFEKAKSEVRALKAQQQEEGLQLQQLRGRMIDAGASLSKLSDHERRLKTDTAAANAELETQKAKLKAIGDRQRLLSEAHGKAGKLQAKAGGLAAAGVGAGAAGLTILRPVGDGLADFRELQSQSTDVGQKGDLARPGSEAMLRRFVALGPKVNQLTTDLLSAEDALAGLGLDPRLAERIVPNIARAGTAYKAELADLGAASFAAYGNLKVPLEENARALDIMAASGKRGAFELKDMAAAFPSLTAAAQGLGQKGLPAIADLSAALQVTRKGTGDSASAATNLENLLQKIAAPGTVKNFAKKGIDLDAAMKAAARQGKTPIEAIAEQTNKALGGDLSKLGYLFEDAQVQQALRPLIQNIDEYRKIRNEIAGAKGVVDADYAQRMQDDLEKEKNARIRLQALRLNAAQALIPIVSSLRDKAMGVVNAFALWAEKHPKLFNALVVTAAAVGVVLVALGGLALAAAAVLAPFAVLQLTLTQAGLLFGPLGSGIAGLAGKAFPWLGRGLLFLGRAFLSFGAAAARAGLMLLANPATWIVLAIVAAVALLAGAAYLVWKNWGPISAWFGKLWEGVKAGASAVWAWLTGLPGRFLGLGAQLMLGLANGITGALTGVKNAIFGAGDKVVGWFKSKLGIHSPSRVFAGLGGHLMAGLDQGIVAGQAGPLKRMRAIAAGVAATMAVGAPQLATAGAEGVAAGLGGSGPQFTSARAARVVHIAGDTITLSITMAPGEDATALERRIEALFERRDRAKAARLRSDYADGED